MSDVVETTEAPAEATADEVAPEPASTPQSRREAAIRAVRAAQSEPEPEPEEQPQEAAEETSEPAPEPKPSAFDLARERARERAQKQAERYQQQQQGNPDLDALRKEIEGLKGQGRPATVQEWATKLKTNRTEAIEELRSLGIEPQTILDAYTQEMLNRGSGALEARLASLEERLQGGDPEARGKLSELEAVREELAALKRSQEYERAIRSYAARTADKAHYPHQADLPSQERVGLAEAIWKLEGPMIAQEVGGPVDYDEQLVAGMTEEYLSPNPKAPILSSLSALERAQWRLDTIARIGNADRAKVDALIEARLARILEAQGAASKQPSNSESPQAREQAPAKQRVGPRTLTADRVAQSSGAARPLTRQERRRNAIARVRQTLSTEE